MSENKFLYEKLESLKDFGMLPELPGIIEKGLSKNIVLRDYQILAFKYFIANYENKNTPKNKKNHTLFHMATGSGKTVIMAGLILYLYTKGYRNFLFFVNQTNVIEKTKDNFTNQLSSKYLFNQELEYLGNRINIRKVDNFSGSELDDDIRICFTTTQKLHLDLFTARENSITYKDFEDNKIVFISDESHHLNTETKKENKNEEEERKSWEYSVMSAFKQNVDNILLEFTATVDLKDPKVEEKYRDKIIFDYQLKSFRKSGYTKDFQNFATESEPWDRALMALVMSEYRKFLFSDYKLDIKPVILLKSKKIDESKAFYETFFEHINNLTSKELKGLYNKINILDVALNYFKEKDETFELLVHSIKDSFTKEKSIIMNGSTDNNPEKQLVVNSLEDKNNIIRIIFTVDMLNEGWDVLNLFDIVRLYDTRQGSGKAGKVGSYTIKEAQLIGRGARYCPFQINPDQEKYKRKYDDDPENKLRILETMYFHSRDDSQYISELRRALIETGLQDENEPIKREYILKETFKNSDFYNKAYVFHNKRVEKSRSNITDIEEGLKNKVYRYMVKSNQGHIINIMDDNIVENTQLDTKIKAISFKEIDYNILRGAAERYNELKFNVIKSKYPNVRSIKEFLTSDNYLGNSTLEIKYFDNIKGYDLRKACIFALSSIAKHILEIKPEYKGTTQFEPIQLKSVLKDKSVYYSIIDSNGGKGDSQNNCINEDYQLDLTKEDWYVFNDNYGTSEEKLFIKFFKTYIAPKLNKKGLQYYVIRNERISDLAIYSFENGERFEPDFLLLVKKQNNEGFNMTQLYAEPKGNNLLEQDKWKEDFLLQLEQKATTHFLHKSEEEYSILGLPFYNEEYKKDEFKKAIDDFIEKLDNQLIKSEAADVKSDYKYKD